MNRVKDYVQFAVWFVGLGYLALWPLTAHDNGVAALGAALLCGGHSPAPVNLLCDVPHALRLSPGLHLIGGMSAVWVIMRLLLRQWRRWREQNIGRTDAAAGSRDAAKGLRIDRWPVRLSRSPAPPPRPVRPRNHFGLRGVPH